jgi:hypothetical protein
MKTAFASLEGRIAPVFDVARQVEVAEVGPGLEPVEWPEALPEDLPGKALRLAELGVAALVCGAISRSLQTLIEARGIHVVPFRSGELGDVMRAWRRGELDRGAYAMPGCGGRRGRRLRRRQRGEGQGRA